MPVIASALVTARVLESNGNRPSRGQRVAARTSDRNFMGAEGFVLLSDLPIIFATKASKSVVA